MKLIYKHLKYFDQRFQKMFVITAFNENLVDAAVSHIHRIPWIGPKLEAPFKELLIKQKEKLHRKVGVVDSAVSSADLGFFATYKIYQPSRRKLTG